MTAETIYTNKSLTNAIYSGTGTFTGVTGSSNVQSFTGPGTWTKPTAAYTMVRVECIGGGGGGSPASGGGGGAFVYGQFPYSSYPGPQTVTVAATGGAAGNPTGSPGTASVFGPGLADTFGLTGPAGAGAITSTGGGGGGMTTGGGPGTTGGAPGGGTGSGTTGGGGTIHGKIFGGGGGGGAGAPAAAAAAGGSSVYGGGGGAGVGPGTPQPGPSIFGGNGGYANAAGTAPGGGGGALAAGARGSVRVITF